MKLMQFWKDGTAALGIVTEKGIIDVAEAAAWMGLQAPSCMMELIWDGADGMESVEKILEAAQEKKLPAIAGRSFRTAPVITDTDRIFCIGLNYRRHAAECHLALPEHPVLFNKYGNALAADGDVVRLMPDYQEYDYEAELVAVIGKETREVPEEKALDYVFGYTCGNDLSTRDLQFARGGQWFMSKTFDRFAPVGPCLVTADEIDPDHLAISSRINGELRQNSSTSDMIFSTAQIIADLSHHFTLLPGDLIFTGTPEGVMHGYPADKKNWLKPGDKAEITIEKIGTLTNTFC